MIFKKKQQEKLNLNIKDYLIDKQFEHLDDVRYLKQRYKESMQKFAELEATCGYEQAVKLHKEWLEKNNKNI